MEETASQGIEIRLSATQQRVVAHRGSDLQVIACAGSGKTESVSRRIAGLISEGAEPASIVAFTFTERAASELKDRIVRRVSEKMGPGFRDRLGPMFVGTIHSYCFRVLQDHVPRFGNYDVLDENRHAGLLSREHRHLGLSKLGQRHWQPIREFAKAADVIGNELISPAKLEGTPLGECYQSYRETLDRFRFLTFATIIAEAVAALEQPAIRQRALSGLRHLVVDEYQDINPAQERLIEIMAQPPVELCVVGDDDQSIYQWRGSEVRNIVEFTSRRPGAATASLDTNRRSRPGIVGAANEFAVSIQSRLPKTMKPARPEADVEVVAWSADTDEVEAEQLVDTIEELHARGFRYRDLAVLFRSVRTSAPPLVDVLKRRGIPFSCGGRTGLFLQPEVALLGEIFAWFVDGEWKDDRFGHPRKANLDHIVQGLTAEFGPNPNLRKYLEDWRALRLRVTRTISLVEDYYDLLDKLGVKNIDTSTPAGASRLGALARFSEVLADFEHIQRRAQKSRANGQWTFAAGPDRGKAYYWALYNYLLHWARDAYEDFSGEPTADLDAVDILTVHQAKGLEWPVVFLPALVQGRFPSARAGQPQDWMQVIPEAAFPQSARGRYLGGDDEERRLFYVALTRARDAVYLSHFCKKARSFKPSPYFAEVAKDSTRIGKLPLPEPDAKEAAKPVPPLDVPFSDIARFDECGHAYWLSTVLGFEQVLAPELGYGKAIHHVLRALAEHVRSEGTIPGEDELGNLLDEEFYLPYASVPAYDQMRKAASRLVESYVRDYPDDLRRVWAVERPFALHFDEGIVSGRADVILDQEHGRTGSLAIVDYKVAHDPKREERYRLQLAVYAAAGRGEGLHVDGAYLHELREGHRAVVDISTVTLATGTVRVRDLISKLRAGEFSPSPTIGRCAGCEYRLICKHRPSDSHP